MKRYIVALAVALLCAACSKSNPTAPVTPVDTTPQLLSCTFADSMQMGWNRWETGGVWDSSRSITLWVHPKPVFSNWANVDSASDSIDCMVTLSDSSQIILTSSSTHVFSFKHAYPSMPGAMLLDMYLLSPGPSAELQLSDSLGCVLYAWCYFSWWSHGTRYTKELVIQ